MHSRSYADADKETRKLQKAPLLAGGTTPTFSPSICWPPHPTYRQLFRNRSCLLLAPSVSGHPLRCRQPPRVVSRQDANPARVLCSPVSERPQAQRSETEGGTWLRLGQRRRKPKT